MTTSFAHRCAPRRTALAAEQETRHGSPFRTTSVDPFASSSVPAARVRRCRAAARVRHPGEGGDGRPVVPARRRSGAGRSRHPRGRAVADDSCPPRAPRLVGPHRLPEARPSVRHDRCRHAPVDGRRRLPLRARDDRDRSRGRRRPGTARPRTAARARARRSSVGDRRGRRARALSEDRLPDVCVAALLRHRHGGGHRLPGAARAARPARQDDATRAGFSSDPWRRARR